MAIAMAVSVFRMIGDDDVMIICLSYFLTILDHLRLFLLLLFAIVIAVAVVDLLPDSRLVNLLADVYARQWYLHYVSVRQRYLKIPR